MRHDFIDHHSRGDSPLHRLHPATKTAVALLVMAAAVAVPFPRYLPLLVLMLFLGAGTLISRVSPLHPLSKMWLPMVFSILVLAPMPFFRPSARSLVLLNEPVHLILYLDSARMMLHLLCRAALALFSVVLLMATTAFTDVLHVLELWRIPRILLRILALFYRYLFLLVDEAHKMQAAVTARRCGRVAIADQLRLYGNLAGALFIRSYERGERVYQAMESRGFDGRFPTLTAFGWRMVDILVLVGTGLVVAGTILLGVGA